MKKRVRLGTAVVLSVVTAAGLLGCGQESESANADEKIVIQVLENDTAKEIGYMDELLTAFNETYEDENIVAVDAKLGEYTDLITNGPDGYGPDVLYQANDEITGFAEKKAVFPIDVDNLEGHELISQAAWDSMKIYVDGKQYYAGIPVDVQEPVIFYRQDMLPEDWKENWDDNSNDIPDFFENWCELYCFSKQIRENDPSPDKDSQYGLMSSLYNSYQNSEFLLSYGAYIFKEKEGTGYDTSDIGFAKGDAAKGLGALRQFAGLMNEGCIDDTIIKNRYAKVASGTYFCAVSTPNTYELFIDKLEAAYEEEGLSAEEAVTKAKENLSMVALPQKFPADGNLDQDSAQVTEWVDTVAMGGIGAYAVSSYTKNKDASMKFVEFATSYEMIQKRQEMLSIIPVRSDVAEELTGTGLGIYENLNEGRIYVMPSIQALDQVWTPIETTLADVATDSFREAKGDAVKYDSLEKLQNALISVDKDIYDAIYTLSE